MVEGFDFINPDSEKTAVNVLDELYKPESINFHTELEIKQIRVMCKVKYFSLRKSKPNASAWQIMSEVFEYYKELKTSYKRKREGAIIKGLSELKDEFLDETIEKSDKK